MVEFLNSFITKNNKYLSKGFFDCKLKLQSDDILNEINIYSGDYSFFLTKYININKMPNININVTAVPLIELSPLCEKIFKDFNESKFVSNLNPGLLKDLENHIETVCTFTHTKETVNEINRLKDIARSNILNNKPISLTDKQFELISQPNEIRLSTSIPPKGYVATSSGYQRIDKDYADKLHANLCDDNNDKASIENRIFIMNFMTSIKTDNHS